MEIGLEIQALRKGAIIYSFCFFLRIIGIPDGKIVGIGLRRCTATATRNHDLGGVFDAVDILTHGSVTQTSLIRQIEIGSAYAVLTVKGMWYVGEPLFVIESLGIWCFAPYLIFYISFSFISLPLFEIVRSISAKTLTRLTQYLFLFS